jgi:succinoglycan biosynthesis transport protein ExoP
MIQIPKGRLVPGQFHPLSIARMLWKHKVMIFAVTGLLTALACVVIYRLQDVYRADAVILVDSQKIPEKFVASTVQENLQDSLNAISQQVLSFGQLQLIIDDLGLYREDRLTKTPQEIFNQMRTRDLVVEQERGFTGSRAGAFRITYEGPDAKIVAEVVNRIANLFIKANYQNREERAAGTSDFLEARVREAKKSLDAQEASLSQFKMRYSGQLPEQEGALMGALNRLQAELQANEDAINRARQNQLLLENTLQLAETSLAADTRALAAPRRSRTVAPAPTPAPTRVDQDLPPAPKPSDAIRAQLVIARSRYLDDHPEVKRLKGELDRALAEEARIEAEKPKRPAPTEGPRVVAETPRVIEAPEPPEALPTAMDLTRDRERVTTTKTQIELLTGEIASRNAARGRIEKDIRDYQSRVESLPLREQQMAALSRDYGTSKANYQSLLDKKMSAEVSGEMEREQQSERFAIADPARIPTKPVKPKRLLYCAIAAVFALALCLGVVLLIELKKDVVLGEWELPSGMPVLGRIASMSPPPRIRTGGMLSGASMIGLIVAGGAWAIPVVRAYLERGI